ncbi:MAG: glycoside hydrolase family 2 protein [Armatimonadota bacterium]
MDRIDLHTGWRLQSSSVDSRGGAELSIPGPAVEGWHETQAPRTVLCSLVKDGTYPDPRYWSNPFRIPDSSDLFNEQQGLAQYSHLPGRNPWRDPWWYRLEFDLSPVEPGQRVWLNLDSINYRADVWVNGHQIADREQIAGMFQRFRLDITEQARAGANALALLIHPVDHPGDPDTQLEVFGPVRAFLKDICNDVTEVMSIGYDCFPTVPDRNMGLVQEISLDATGPVDIRHPFVRTDLPLPELNPARLTVSAELVNAAAQPVRGLLAGEIIAPEGQPVARFTRPTTLLSHETRLIRIAPTDAPELAIVDPQLWYPNTYGEQPLYTLRLRFEPDGQPSTETRTRFGIRRLDRELYELDGAHGFRLCVNGVRVFQRGGYIQPEMMFDWDRERVEAEIKYFAHANLNYVAFEDIPNPPDWYLDLCDQYGIMFWTCFYDCYWLQYNRPWDIDTALLEDCTVDIVKRYRNHPAVVVHMAQNEGETREDVYEMWRRTVLAHDDTRFLIPSGSFPDYRKDTPPWFDRELPVGCNDYMPKTYSWQMPWVYYELVQKQRNWMFMIESCSASVPPVESLERFMPHLRELPQSDGTDPRYPLDEAWAHFGANSYYEWFDRALRLYYGEPTDVSDYVWKAQLVGYDQHRAFFEAVHHRMWNITSGYGHWKLNSAFPDVQWQIHDWFLRPMVSLYAIRKACAKLAVQLSPLDNVISVINNHAEGQEGLTVQAAVYDLQAHKLHEQTGTVSVAGNSYGEALALDLPEAAKVSVYFVKIKLLSATGELLADNFYWLSPRLDDFDIVFKDDFRTFPANKPLAVPKQTPCFPELSAMPQVELAVQARETCEGVGVEITNPTGQLAFFIRVRLTDANGEEALPVYWSDNYFSLLPGESKQLRVSSTGAQVRLDGWNIVPKAADVVSS